MGEALEAAFASVARITLSFERLAVIKDPLRARPAGWRGGGGAVYAWHERWRPATASFCCRRRFFCHFAPNSRSDPEAEAPAADRRWSRLMEVGVQQTRLPVTAILEEVPMSLGDVANFQVGGLLPLQCNDFNAIRLECSGRGMFTCKLGQVDGRYRLEVESAIAHGCEAT